MTTKEGMERNKEIAQQFKERIAPSGYLVAVKLLKTLEGFEKVKRPDKPFALCQLISHARYIGRTRVLTADDEIGCYLAPDVLGFKKMPEEAWKRYTGWFKTTDEAARKMLETVPRLKMGEYSAIFLSPLERCPVKPDVVVFLGNAAQMLVLITAYLYDGKEGSLNFSFSGAGACADVIVSPVQDHKPRIALPGNAWRILGLPSDTDLICGIPGDSLEEVLKGIEFFYERGGPRYPVLWQHIDWEPSGTIADVLRVGCPTWLK